MSRQLTGMSILVADDQMDVMRTLCSSLHEAGAGLLFVPDGQKALESIATSPVDLMIIDLKMRPGEWGGLWLLEQVKNCGQHVPVIVLSGEGWGVREAFRLGAIDYIEKSEVAQELLSRCVETLDRFHLEALERAGKEFPAPLAYRFARYGSAIDPDKRLLEGLLVVEEILRFGVIIGLSGMKSLPLRGIRREQLSALSMGTWLDLFIALADLSAAELYFTRFYSWLIPKKSDRDLIRRLVRLRNDIAHGRSPDHTTSALLEHLLRRFAHRALSLWRDELAVPQTMSFDGESFEVTYASLTGLGPPKFGTVRVIDPLTTGHPILLGPARLPLSLTPWLIAYKDEATGSIRCLQFDGTARRAGRDDSAPLRYIPTDGRSENVPSTVPGSGCWGDLARWADDD